MNRLDKKWSIAGLRGYDESGARDKDQNAATQVDVMSICLVGWISRVCVDARAMQPSWGAVEDHEIKK
jgi:hypothetical protein